MVRFYADEQFPYRIVEVLRELGHDILTVQAADNRGLSDEEVLAFAIQENRAILTFNRRHFIRLHNQQPNHAGIIVCKDDPDREGIALRIKAAIASIETLNGMLIRVNRPE
jgi:predicted nuclease of predicted toxin-antitoxin system